MAILRRARNAEERMDRPDVDRHHLDDALHHVAGVNRWLGARRALLRHLPRLLPDTGSTRILDVGTGSADLPVALAHWGRRHHRPLRITALDLHPATLDAARRRIDRQGSAGNREVPPADPETSPIHLVRGDALALPFPAAAFDLALLSMTLHHMDGTALVGCLRELGRVARGGHVLVGELERSLPNYLGARLLAATLWRRNPVTRHDGPLSVLRAFTPGELRELARDAGLRHPVVTRHPIFRLVLRAEA